MLSRDGEGTRNNIGNIGNVVTLEVTETPDKTGAGGAEKTGSRAARGFNESSASPTVGLSRTRFWRNPLRAHVAAAGFEIGGGGATFPHMARG